MSIRKRKISEKPLPAFRVTKVEENEENDLKKAKANALKALEDNKKKEQEWYDQELDKNLKKQQ